MIPTPQQAEIQALRNRIRHLEVVIARLADENERLRRECRLLRLRVEELQAKRYVWVEGGGWVEIPNPEVPVAR